MPAGTPEGTKAQGDDVGRLFWKFFFFFWLAQLSTGTGIGVMIWLASHVPDSRLAAVDASPPARFEVAAAAATLRHGGVAALRDLLAAQRGEHAPQLVVVDEQQHPLFAASVVPLAPEVLAQARALAAGAAAHTGVEQVAADDGHTYLLFAAPRAHRPPPGEMAPPGGPEARDLPNSPDSPNPPNSPPPPQPPHSRSPFPPLLPIIAGALVSLVFAALLARYFSKPIRSLRSAFAAAAAGDLAQNLGPAMGRRRDELADLGRDFDRMAGQLKILMDSQRRLLHDVSHELRSPLARLQAATGLARQQPERMEDSLARIDRESVRMDKLVSELLALSRLEAGMADRLDDSVDVGELLGNVVDDARFEAGARQCRIELAADRDVFVRGNAELLHSAAENIVRNALKHSPAGGLVEVGAAVVAGEVIVRVVDRGPGVAEADLASIFKPFFRSASENPADGHGLGLAISQRVVESLHGRVAAANRDGGGLCVTISLPALAASANS